MKATSASIAESLPVDFRHRHVEGHFITSAFEELGICITKAEPLHRRLAVHEPVINENSVMGYGCDRRVSRFNPQTL